MKVFLNCLILSVSFILYQSVQQKDIKVIKEFIVASSAKKTDTKAILNKYFPARDEKQREQKIAKTRDSIHSAVVKTIHDKLQGKDLSKITITPYEKLPKGEINISPVRGSQIYVVKYNNTKVFSALMNKNELMSVITMNKGGVRIFLTL